MTRLYLSNGRCPESFHCQLVSSLSITARTFLVTLCFKLYTNIQTMNFWTAPSNGKINIHLNT